MKFHYLYLSVVMVWWYQGACAMDDSASLVKTDMHVVAIGSTSVTVKNDSETAVTLITYRPDPGFGGSHIIVKEESMLAPSKVVNVMVTKTDLLGSVIAFKYGGKMVRLLTKQDNPVISIVKAGDDCFSLIRGDGQGRSFSLGKKHTLFYLDHETDGK